MADSFFTPRAVEPIGVPWGWNPAATFVAAYNQSAENRRAQEKAELDAWMTKTLFPLKESQAKLEIQKLQNEVERGTLLNTLLADADSKSHQSLMSGMREVQNGNIPTVSRFGPSSYLSKGTQQQATQKRTLSDSLVPKQP